MTTTQRAQLVALIRTMNELAAITRAETELFLANDIRGALRLTDDKNRLAAAYQSQLAALNEGEGLKGVGPGDRQVLIRARDALDQTLARNLEAVGRARDLTQKVVEVLADSYRQAYEEIHGSQAATYGAGGRVATTPTALPVSLDFKL